MKRFNKALLMTAILAALAGCQTNKVSEMDKMAEPAVEVAKEAVVVKKENNVIVKGTEELDTQIITIAATADVHGRIYPYEYAIDAADKDAGFAKINTIVKEARKFNPNMILMDVGDTVQDNSAELFNDLDTHPMVEAMNTMGYDVWTLGNHEFNFEKEFIVRNINNFDGTVLSANIMNEADDSYFVNAYQMFDVNGAKVAVVGLTPPHVPMWEASAPDHYKGLVFEKLIEATQATLDELEGKYDVLVGAFHVGRNGEYGGSGMYDLANAFPQFDIIFGGHEHAKYVEDVNGVKILEPGKYGWALAAANITVNKVDGKWEIAEIKAENIQTKQLEADVEILEKFADIHEQAIADANKVVGQITEDFIDGVDYITGEDKVTTMPTAQLEDTAVINLINKVQMLYADAEVSSAALFNFGSNLQAGDFKKKDVAFIYKYGNTLVGVNITGENLLKYMEWSASYYNTWKEGDITISFNPKVRGYNYDMFYGLEYDINLSKDAGNRIENVTFNGQDFEIDKTYKLAVNNYRFGTLLKNGWVSPEDKYFDSYLEMVDGTVRALIVDYTEKKGGVLSPETTNNWKLTGIHGDYPGAEEIYEKIRAGEIIIPRSEDGRTMNVRAINIYEM